VLKKSTSSHNQHEKLVCTTTTSHKQHQKQLPQPQLQPNKPQKTTQTRNKTQNTTTQLTCAHKTPTTTTKEETNPKKQPEKTFVHKKQSNNYQKENSNITAKEVTQNGPCQLCKNTVFSDTKKMLKLNYFRNLEKL
jgi:hypothetical protein